MSTSVVEQLSPNVSREWLCAGRVVVLTAHTPHRDEFDLFASATEEVLRAWSPVQPLMILLDLARATLTPYGRKCLSDLLLLFPLEVHGRLATILPISPLSKGREPFTQRFLEKRFLDLQSRFFKTRAEALVWLTQDGCDA